VLNAVEYQMTGMPWDFHDELNGTPGGTRTHYLRIRNPARCWGATGCRSWPEVAKGCHRKKSAPTIGNVWQSLASSRICTKGHKWAFFSTTMVPAEYTIDRLSLVRKVLPFLRNMAVVLRDLLPSQAGCPAAFSPGRICLNKLKINGQMEHRAANAC